MSEHAFDPMPDEQKDFPEDALSHTPNATVTRAQLNGALKGGRWGHEEPSLALWLNTSFSVQGQTVAVATELLKQHGIIVVA